MSSEDYQKSIDKAKNASMLEYLENNGVKLHRRGGRHVCNSVFNEERNPSMMIYPTNSFYDWSSGKHGDTIALVMQLENVGFKQAVSIINNESYGNAEIADAKEYARTKKKKKFFMRYYLARNREDVVAIKKYASSRSIRHGYFMGQFWQPTGEDEYMKRLGLGFLHKDISGRIVGAKFRGIDNIHPKYQLRGSPGIYCLENLSYDIEEDTPLYICESETSANSLWNFMMDNDHECIVISFGGNKTFSRIPIKYIRSENRFLIVDYDGDEKTYEEVLAGYEYLEAKPIKMELEKGEDINTLYHNKEFEKLNELIR